MCSEKSNHYQFPIASSNYQRLLHCATVTANDLTTKKIETPQHLFQQNVDLIKNDDNLTIPFNNTSISSLEESNYNNYFTSNSSIESFYNNNMPLQAMSSLSNLSPSFAYSQNYMIPNSYNYRSNQYNQSFLQSNAFSYYWPTINTNFYDGFSRIDATEMSTRSIESITPISFKKSISNYENFQEQKKIFSASINNDWNSTKSISITNLNENSMRYFNEYNALPTNLQEDNYLTNKEFHKNNQFQEQFYQSQKNLRLQTFNDEIPNYSNNISSQIINSPTLNFSKKTQQKLNTDNLNDLSNEKHYKNCKSETKSNRIFSCSICGKQYCRKSTLKAHMKYHIGQKSFSCQICGKTFSQAANLTAHKRIHTGEKPFKCYICLRPFSQSSSLVTHKRTHTGERPYPCNQCDKAFTDSSTLTKHLRTHTGQKPYTCYLCLMRFSQSGNLHRHMKTHKNVEIL